MNEPSYLALYKSGELKNRLHRLEQNLAHCTICPRNCAVNRLQDEPVGICRAGYRPYITTICDHHGEEPVLSGSNGSGTVFFGSCNLRCIYCQNWQISQDRTFFKSQTMNFRTAAEQIVRLQDELKVHNINFVSPSHFVPQMVRIILEAIPMGLHLPIVYNSNAYDSLETLRLLDGIVDIYLPDFKYWDERSAIKYSQGRNYPSVARRAIKEMYRQVGLLQTDSHGHARRGLIIRHLILPNNLSDTDQVLAWIARELHPEVAVSLMSQYRPTYKAKRVALLSRQITYSEYERSVQRVQQLHMPHVFLQEMTAPDYYLPDFRRDGHPFEQ